mmetsp:Transcript_939/g.2168  ORF Transcript_939/g.2168 Transcript_939/m.2168 type:complete len:223 (+) Transcript_939:1066-1734(+)
MGLDPHFDQPVEAIHAEHQAGVCRRHGDRADNDTNDEAPEEPPQRHPPTGLGVILEKWGEPVHEVPSRLLGKGLRIRRILNLGVHPLPPVPRVVDGNKQSSESTNVGLPPPLFPRPPPVCMETFHEVLSVVRLIGHIALDPPADPPEEEEDGDRHDNRKYDSSRHIRAAPRTQRESNGLCDPKEACLEHLQLPRGKVAHKILRRRQLLACALYQAWVTKSVR